MSSIVENIDQITRKILTSISIEGTILQDAIKRTNGINCTYETRKKCNTENSNHDLIRLPLENN